MPRISIKVSKQEKIQITNYAHMHGLSVSEFVRRTILEKIKNELGIQDSEKR